MKKLDFYQTFLHYIKMSEPTHYKKNTETVLNKAKDHYENNKEVLRKKAKNNYRELFKEEKNIKTDYEKNR